MVAKCLHPHLHLPGLTSAGKAMDRAENACQEGEISRKSFDGVERAQAEMDAAPIVGNQKQVVSAGVSPADTS